jgi:hypothetical protein
MPRQGAQRPRLIIASGAKPLLFFVPTGLLDPVVHAEFQEQQRTDSASSSSVWIAGSSPAMTT